MASYMNLNTLLEILRDLKIDKPENIVAAYVKKTETPKKSCVKKVAFEPEVEQTSEPAQKILNPTTNRWVKADGKIGKELANNAKVPETIDEPEAQPIQKILNPTTNRWVKPDGKVGKKLAAKVPETIDEWKALNGYALKEGECVRVIGESGNTYFVKKSNKNPFSVWCSCPAWKYQRLTPTLRTCKHCIAVCGKEKEDERIKNAALELAHQHS